MFGIMGLAFLLLLFVTPTQLQFLQALLQGFVGLSVTRFISIIGCPFLPSLAKVLAQLPPSPPSPAPLLLVPPLPSPSRYASPTRDSLRPTLHPPLPPAPSVWKNN